MLRNKCKQDVGGKTGSFYRACRIIFMIKRDLLSVLHKCRHESAHENDRGRANGRESVHDRVSGHDHRHESDRVRRASDRGHHHENGRVLHRVQKRIFQLY